MSKTQPCVKKHEGLEFENKVTGLDFSACFRSHTVGIPLPRIDTPSVAKNFKIPYVNQTKSVHAVQPLMVQVI
jgi:hypothetical protein